MWIYSYQDIHAKDEPHIRGEWELNLCDLVFPSPLRQDAFYRSSCFCSSPTATVIASETSLGREEAGSTKANTENMLHDNKNNIL